MHRPRLPSHHHCRTHQPPASDESGREAAGDERQGAEALAGGGEDGVGDGRGETDDGRLARAKGRLVLAVEDHNLNGRGIAEARQTVAADVRVGDTGRSRSGWPRTTRRRCPARWRRKPGCAARRD